MAGLASSNARARAFGVKRTMEIEAAYENKPNHVRHVQHQTEYADAVGEAVLEEAKEWFMKEAPSLIQKELSKPSNQVKVVAKVDERSLSDAKKKITDMLKSIFH